MRPELAKEMLEKGLVSIINDVSAGHGTGHEMPPYGMMAVIAQFQCPYVMMHSKGASSDMMQRVMELKAGKLTPQ